MAEGKVSAEDIAHVDVGLSPMTHVHCAWEYKAQGVTASFGMTGRWAEQNPDLLRRIVREGHHLINHTYDHESFTGRSTGSPSS